MTDNNSMESEINEDDKQLGPQSELKKALTDAGLENYTDVLAKKEFKTLQDLGDDEDEVKKKSK